MASISPVIELEYARKDRKPDRNGWVLDYNFLKGIQKSMEGVTETDYVSTNLESIECILMVAANLVDLYNQDRG